MSARPHSHSCLWGLGTALALVAAWGVSLIGLLLMPLALSPLTLALLLPAVLARAFLQTGLFIVAHDAMHGSLLPGNRRWNDRIGRCALALYACLPWESCRRNHQLHHLAPGSSHDPDHHCGRRSGPLAWYLRFMAAYLTPARLAILLGCWLAVAGLLSARIAHPLPKLLLFWTLPLLVSSLQLFVFGTYLPHREASARSGDRHRATSLAWPEPLSLLACFHFGYHWEHHEHPHLPWYRLPAQRRLMTVPHSTQTRLALPVSRG